jgi:hypothetical protein
MGELLFNEEQNLSVQRRNNILSRIEGNVFYPVALALWAEHNGVGAVFTSVHASGFADSYFSFQSFLFYSLPKAFHNFNPWAARVGAGDPFARGPLVGADKNHGFEGWRCALHQAFFLTGS